MRRRSSVSPLHRVVDANQTRLRLVKHRLFRPRDFGAVSVLPRSMTARIGMLRLQFPVHGPGDGTLGVGGLARVGTGPC